MAGAQELERGRSIADIAREVGRHPATVGYWVRKHGLRSQHSSRHAAKGRITRDALAKLVTDGLSGRQIAVRLGVSQATVRHWLLQYGLETERAILLQLRASGLTDQGNADATAYCPQHGVTAFRRRADGGWRCLVCRAQAVVARRRSVKATLVAEAGGGCALCGYSRSMAALQFHHLDATAKEFQISQRGVTRSIAAARAEAAKCVLLCANCHAEVEAGLATIPVSPQSSDRGNAVRGSSIGRAARC